MTRSCSLLFVAALASAAHAAPRIGVVTLSYEGMSQERADEIVYEIAGAVATQIEGEAIAGPSVREQLPSDEVKEGCEERPDCGRRLARLLKADEALLVALRTAGKTIIINGYRAPRDPTRPGQARTLRLVGGKAKRTAAVMEFATGFYPSGSVVPYVEPARPVQTPVAAEVSDSGLRASQRPAGAEGKSGGGRTGLWIGVGVGVGVVAIAGLALGLVFGLPPSPTGPAVTLP